MTRHITQPGPPATARIHAVPTALIPITATLPPGPSLLDALTRLCTVHGVGSACLTLSGGALFPFAYVIPSLPPDPSHAAFYSDVHRPAAPCPLGTAALTFGRRDGAPFFHCHALWTYHGNPGCGHVLPDATGIAAPILVQGVGLLEACFEVHPDPETGFSLFTPCPRPPSTRSSALRGIALRLAPNQDLVTALENATQAAGFRRATLHGGVASIIEARFTDAPPITGYATELLVRTGTIAPAASKVDIAIVDYTGAIGQGTLTPGDNPVLMTFEGVLQFTPVD